MTTTLSTKGQIVLPASARRRLGLRPGMSFRCSVQNGNIVLAPEKAAPAAPKLVKSPKTGLVYAAAAKDAPVVTSEQVRAALADFP